MTRHPEPSLARPSRLVLAVLLALAATALGAAPFDVPDADVAPVVAALRERFEVLTLTSGYVLQPRRSEDFELLEVHADAVFVDGEEADAATLADYLGADAELVAGLQGGDALARAREVLERRSERATSERRDDEERARRDRRRSRPRISSDSRVSIGSRLVVDEDETARQAVVILGSLDLRGRVRGDAVVVGGSAVVDGLVEGDLTVVGGSIELGPEAEVEGEVTAVGGAIRRHPDARVDGEVTQVSVAPGGEFPWFDFDLGDGWAFWRDWDFPRHRGRGFDLARLLFNTALLTVLVLLTTVVARPRVERIAEHARREVWMAGFVGLASQILLASVLVVGSIVLVISLVGIPLFVILLPLSLLFLAVVLVLGYAGAAAAVGRVMSPRFPTLAAVLVGTVLIQMWQLFGETLRLAGGFLSFAAFVLLFLGFVLKYAAWTVGLGAVVLDRLAARAVRTGASAPPHLPDLDAAGPAAT